MFVWGREEPAGNGIYVDIPVDGGGYWPSTAAIAAVPVTTTVDVMGIGYEPPAVCWRPSRMAILGRINTHMKQEDIAIETAINNINGTASDSNQ